MPEVANLQVVVGADTSAAEKGLDSLSTKVGGVGSAIQSALGAAAVGAVAGLGAAFVGSVKSAADFEKQISNIGAVAGASQEEMAQLRQLTLDLGKATSFSASEAGQGVEELVKAGVSLADVMGGGAKAALDLAAAGGIAVGEAAEIASNALNTFGLKGSDMAHVADVMAGAANASAIGMNDLKFAMSASGAVAAQVGIGFDDLATAIALMGQHGIKGSDAGTSLKTMMMNLVPATDKAANLMKELGIITADGANQFFDAEGKAKGFAEISGVLQKALAGMSKEQQIATLRVLFGSDAIRAASVFLQEGTEGYEKMAEAMGKVTAADVAAERLNNLWGSVEQLKGSLETAAITLGSYFLPALKGVADKATGYVNDLTEAFEQIPDAIETVKQVFAGDWVSDESIKPFTRAVGEAAVTVRALYTTVQPILRQLGEIWQKVMVQDITGALDQFLALVQSVAARLAPIIAQWGQAFIAWIGPMIPPFLAALGNVIGQLLSWIAAQVPVLAAALVAWATEWVRWLVDAAPILIAAAWAFIKPLLDWIGEQIPVLAAQLLEWGQQFVAWVAPMIPPLLEQLGVMGKQLLDWIIAQVPPLIAQLLKWGAEFVAWVAPQIPLMIEELGRLWLAMNAWALEQLPGIIAFLVKWGLLFGVWVATTAIPELVKALPGILVKLGEWTANTVVELAKLTLKLGLALVEGIWQGFQDAWSVIGGKIKETIQSAFTLPSFRGGGGAAGSTQLSYTGDGSWQATTSGGFANNAERLAFVRMVAAQYGHDPETVARAAMLEGAGAAGPVGDGGRSFGALQAYTGGGMGNTFQQQTGLDPSDPNNEKALVEWQIRQLSQTGWTPYHGPTNAGFSTFQGINTGSAAGMQKLMPGDVQDIISEVVDAVPLWTEAMGVIQDSTTVAFRHVASEGTDAGRTLVTTSTDSMGNVTTIYTEAGRVIGAIITNAAGEVVNRWGAMSQAVSEQTTQMGATALTSVTQMGDGILTNTTDTAGNMIATITDMSGNVTSQYATLANGVQLTMGDMSAGVLTSQTNLGDGVMTVVQDMAGNYLVTITDLKGNVTNQYVQMAGDAASMASQTSNSFGTVASATEKPISAIGQYRDAVSHIPTPDLSDAVSEFNRVAKAADKAASSVKDINSALKGGYKSGSGNNPFGKAAGGPVNMGQTYLIGEQGPELFTPNSNGYITPNHKIQMGDGIDYDRLERMLSRPNVTVTGVGLNDVADEVVRKLSIYELTRGGGLRA